MGCVYVVIAAFQTAWCQLTNQTLSTVEAEKKLKKNKLGPLSQFHWVSNTHFNQDDFPKESWQISKENAASRHQAHWLPTRLFINNKHQKKTCPFNLDAKRTSIGAFKLFVEQSELFESLGPLETSLAPYSQEDKKNQAKESKHENSVLIQNRISTI